MIAKHVPMRSVNKSSILDLVAYLTDPQRQQERVGCITITHCHSDRPDIAALEALNTQRQNTRARSDKTYHLIVSFRQGETIDDATVRTIESRLCDALGFGEHQRISVAHHDTNNLHLHVAINKIHPTRYTLHDPYKAYHTIGRLCEEIEQEFHLHTDNHRAQKTGSENRANDMERHAGIESLIGWIQRECLGSLREARSWSELHQVFRENGLTIEPRGQGLVITDGKGTCVRASSVSRDLSKPSLERRLGTFQLPSEEPAQRATHKGQYEPHPVRTQIDTRALYARYQQERYAHAKAKALALAEARAMRSTLIHAAKRGARLKHDAIKLTAWKRHQKLLAAWHVRRTKQATLHRIADQYQRQRDTIATRYHRRTWADWLRQQAIAGDREALQALRARDAAQGLQGDTIAASGRRDMNIAVGAEQDHVTKQGTIIYRVGLSAVRDDGSKLQVSRETTDEGIHAALRLAMRKYGTDITIHGSEGFKDRVTRIAADAHLAIQFSNSDLDARRRRSVQNAPKETTDEQTAGRETEAPRRSSRTHRPFPIGEGVRFGSRWDRLRRKSHLGSVGQSPPPEGTHRLRGLSELGVVRFSNRSEMLLPRDVPGHVEHEGPQPNHRLRRDVDRSGLTAATAHAIARYIAERDEKRTMVPGIPQHRIYEARDAGLHRFGGVRTIDGIRLALIYISNDIVLVPIDEATQRRLTRITIGDAVRVTPTGSIRIKTGRTR